MINEILTELEVILINEEQPGYLEISRQKVYDEEFIYILLSKEDYKFSSLSERITSIFELLKWHVPKILEQYSIIVETFTEKELTELMRLYLK